MEESSSTRTAKSCPREETTDWRTIFTTDARRKIISQILDSLKVPLSDPDARSGATKLVQQFEETMFRNARTKDDYDRAITRKLSIIDQSGHRTASVSSSNPGLPPNSVVAGGGQSFSLRNAHQASSEFSGNSVRQGMQSIISANDQREIPGTKPLQKVFYQQHQLQESQQFLKHKVHQSSIGSIHVRDFHNNHHHLQQQHIVSQSSPFCSQNQALPAASWQPPFTEQSSTAVFLRNQVVSQEDNLEQQLSSYWNSMPNSFQRPLGLQSNASCFQQPRRMIGSQLKAVNLKSHGHSVHSFQVEGTSLHPKAGQRLQSVNKVHQALDSSNQWTQEATLQSPETLASLLNTQNANNQQKVLLSQHKLAEASSASSETAASREQLNMAELQDQAYQKFQSMKEEYLPVLTHVYNSLNEKCQKSQIPEIVGKHRKKIIAVERIIKVLSTPQANLTQFSMEKFKYFQQTVKQFVNYFKLENSISVQPPHGSSQISQLPQHNNEELHQFHQVSLTFRSKQAGPSRLSSTQQVGLSPQPNVINSPCSRSLMELEQHSAPNSLDHAARPEIHDIPGTPQNKVFHDTELKSFDSATKLLQQNSNNTFLQQKQRKHQKMQQHNAKQHIQPQMILQHMQIRNTQPVNTSGMFQQNPLISQPLEHSYQMLFPITRRLQSTSQMYQHSSAQVDQNLPLPRLNSGTSLNYISSPSITCSHSTPFTPFSIPADYKKQPSGSSPLLIPESSGHPQTNFALTAVDTENEVLKQSLPIAALGIAASRPHTESASPNKKQISSATENPLDRLLKAVQSLSTEALSTAVSDIGSAMKMVDEIPVTVCNDSETDVGENLHGRKFSSQYRCSFKEKVKRKLHNTSAMATDAFSCSISKTDNLNSPTGQIGDLNSSEASRTKRRRIEPSNALLDEIKSINKQLLETVLDLDSTEAIAAIVHGEGTIVRCIHNPVALDENLKLQHASWMSVLPLRLLVPTSYPNSSPVILDGFTSDCSGESKDSIDLSEKTRLRFSFSLRKLSEPMSLAEMATTWDVCARAVLLECAQSVGGGCFTSRYGKWENCLAA